MSTDILRRAFNALAPSKRVLRGATGLEYAAASKKESTHG
jgi:hypothetical protein